MKLFKTLGAAFVMYVVYKKLEVKMRLHYNHEVLELTNEQVEKLWECAVKQLPHPEGCPRLTDEQAERLVNLLESLYREKSMSTLH
jgi:hypothetical protein